MLQVNGNIDHNDPLTQLGGRIINATLVQDGYINANGDSLMGIAIEGGNPNVSVLGGSYRAPDIHSGTTSGPIGLASWGPGTLVDGFTVTGDAQGGYNIFVYDGVVQ